MSMSSSSPSNRPSLPAEGLKTMIEQIFVRMGVENVRVEIQSNSEVKINLETVLFARYRSLIDAWFDVVEQNDQWTVLKERKRGTGLTAH